MPWGWGWGWGSFCGFETPKIWQVSRSPHSQPHMPPFIYSGTGSWPGGGCNQLNYAPGGGCWRSNFQIRFLYISPQWRRWGFAHIDSYMHCSTLDSYILTVWTYSCCSSVMDIERKPSSYWIEVVQARIQRWGCKGQAPLVPRFAPQAVSPPLKNALWKRSENAQSCRST